jgi:hypothetical protein
MKEMTPSGSLAESALVYPANSKLAPSTKDNTWKLEGTEPDGSAMTSDVGNRIRSYLVVSKRLIGQTMCTE